MTNYLKKEKKIIKKIELTPSPSHLRRSIFHIPVGRIFLIFDKLSSQKVGEKVFATHHKIRNLISKRILSILREIKGSSGESHN